MSPFTSHHLDIRVILLRSRVTRRPLTSHGNNQRLLRLRQIQGQLDKVLDDMSASLCTLKEGMSYTKQLPSKGFSQSQVLDKIREYETLSKCASTP